MKTIYVQVSGSPLATKSEFVCNYGVVYPVSMLNPVNLDRWKKSPNIINISKSRGAAIWTVQALEAKLRAQLAGAAKEQLKKSASNDSQKKLNTMLKQGNKNSIDPAISAVRKQTGTFEAQRAESAKTPKASKTITLTVDATSGTLTADPQFIIGDGLDIIESSAQFAGYKNDALDAASGVISGTFGANTLLFLHNFAKSNPLVVKGMQIQTNEATGSVFNGDFMQLVEADFQNVVVPRPVDFNMTQDGSQFNLNQRLLKDFQMMISTLNGIAVKFPRGQKITWTFDVESYEDANFQKKVF